MRPLRIALVLPLLLPFLAACGDTTDGSPDVRDRPSGTAIGTAADAVSCAGRLGERGENTGVYDGGEAYDDPEAAVAGAADQVSPADVLDELRETAAEEDRRLFTYDAGGRTVVAVVVRDGRTVDDDGWYVESWARCDLAELPPEVAEASGTQVWTDASGAPVDTRTITSYAGPEHCDWQDMTFLELGRATYVRRPDMALARDVGFVVEDWDPSTTLPDDAHDTGFERDGERLWLAPDRSRAYVGGPDGVEMWPREREPLGCA
ncbi:hypothetical protein H5V45_00265 [Nocardioides sp. KIGAM211]|uniref:Lipoprotein n=1 Tax=Nocardioides luti TaxID=2761101 RepID=A0A7X0V8L7_9ACTN|nr:hypothetical protein [Nocardioides luti]MBB6625739.1 hypothetical protein [Nocardioides luti]